MVSCTSLAVGRRSAFLLMHCAPANTLWVPHARKRAEGWHCTGNMLVSLTRTEALVTEEIWRLAVISNNSIRWHRGATAASAMFAARFTMLLTATGHTLLMRSAMTSGQSCGVFGRCVLPRMGASLQRQSKLAHQHVMSMRTSRVRDLRQQSQRSAGSQHALSWPGLHSCARLITSSHKQMPKL